MGKARLPLSSTIKPPHQQPNDFTHTQPHKVWKQSKITKAVDKDGKLYLGTHNTQHTSKMRRLVKAAEGGVLIKES